LEAARDAERPRAVPEVASQLAPDGGDGVRQEATADRRLVPVDGLDQADDGDLDQVGGGLAAVLITAGEPVCQREVGVDDLLAQHGPPGVARWQLEVLDEQRLEAVELAVRLSAGRRGGSGRPFRGDRKSTRLNSSHVKISYAVFCLKKQNSNMTTD